MTHHHSLPALLHSTFSTLLVSPCQEREVEVAGMCWWGESALVVASRLKHGFILLLYSRKHLSSEALMLPPIKLPVGMRPLFMQVRACACMRVCAVDFWLCCSCSCC